MDRHARNKESFEAIIKVTDRAKPDVPARVMLSTMGQAWPHPALAMKACYNGRWKKMPLAALVHVRRALQFAFDEAQKIRRSAGMN